MKACASEGADLLNASHTTLSGPCHVTFRVSARNDRTHRHSIMNNHSQNQRSNDRDVAVARGLEHQDA